MRSAASPLGPTFIPSLDAFLSTSDNTPQDGPAADEDQSGIHSSINRGDMIEIQGPSGCGKTQLALFLVMTTLLPSRIKFRDSSTVIREVEMGGKSQTATFVHSAAHGSPVRRLAQLMSTHIRACLLSLDLALDDRDAVVRSTVIRSLGRLTVYTLPLTQSSFTTSSSSPYAPLIATLHAIHRRPHPTKELGLLIIDGIGDAFWPSRAHVRSKTTHAIRGEADPTMEDLVRAIDAVRRDVGCAVIVTNQAIWRSAERRDAGQHDNAAPVGDPFWAQHLPPPYPSPFSSSTRPTDAWPLTTHITLLPTSLTQIRPDVTLVEVLKPGGEGDKRERARAAARARGVVRRGNRARVGEFEFVVGEGEVLSW